VSGEKKKIISTLKMKLHAIFFFVVKGYVFTNINLFVNVNVSGMLQEENL